MKNILSLHSFQHVKKDYWLMLVTLFSMKLGQFMLLPFLAIYLAKYSHSSASLIGFTVGTGPFIYGVAGLGGGIIIDRLGSKKVMVGALFLSSITLFLFFYSYHIAWYFLMNALTGITRAFFDISSKSYGISTFSIEQRKISFSLRFMVVNSAAAIGPVIGAYFALSDSLEAFKIISIIYFIFAFLSIFTLQNAKYKDQMDSANNNATFKELINILFSDKLLQLLLFISVFIWIIYSQIDSTLPQYLYAEFNNGIKIYSLLLIINAIGCIALQLITSNLIKNINEYVVSFFSTILFGVSFFIIAFALSSYGLILGMIFLTIAEIIIMPLNELLISRIAPNNRLGTYYGILGFAMIGLGIGPMCGGMIYQAFNAKTVFITCSLLCLLILILYRKFFLKHSYT